MTIAPRHTLSTQPASGWLLRMLVLLLLLLLVACSGGEATAAGNDAPLPGLDPSHGTPITPEWAAIVDSLDAPITDRDASPCHRGEPECLEAVILEMEARLAARPCAHTAPFAFTYLEMTRGVATEAAEFDDATAIALIDARFAQQYFDAFDNWQAGRHDDVPAPWQMAFATADREQASAAVDLVLGMNAHISRDLAYIVAGLVEDAPDIREQPEDYLRVNEVIAGVKSPMLMRAADRFDPNLLLLDAELGVAGAPDPVTLISDWRALSFDLGLQLATASSPQDQRAAIAEIERTSTAAAAVLIAAQGADGTQELAGAIAGQPEGAASGSAAGSAQFLDRDARRAYCERPR